MMPFAALVGVDAARQALLLLAVEPLLRGVVLAAGAGTGKSSLARGFRALLAATPGTPAPPMIELPLNADEESLLGGLDIELTLRSGRRTIRPGILARAHGGLVYVDGLNLLPDSAANLLLDALERGEVHVEREGLSLRSPARFALIGSYDPAEGVPRRHLLDRVGLLVMLPAASPVAARAEVIRRNQAAARPGPAMAAWDEEGELLRATIAAAREHLPTVRISDRQVEQLCAAAVAFGVEGQRADTFAVRAACAAAALALRDAVEQEDLELAIRLVILPRATRMPAPPPAEPPPPEPEQPRNDQARQDPEDQAPEQEPEPREIEEQVLSALAAELPVDLTQLPFRVLRRGRAGSRGATSGTRGRHIRSTPGDPRRRRIDVAATLRTAAPWQPLRRLDAGDPARHQAAPDQRAIQLRSSDLRVKQYRSKAGALFCFLVDASGSMALHRMRQAKGAVHTLLQQAYVHRDQVALLAFRGNRADLLLPPSQSVELARRALDLLPTGGGTPLATGLLAALDVARQARMRGMMQVVLILLTDGRANVGIRAERSEVAAEVQQVARAVVEAGLTTIVVDTQRSYLSRGEARTLAGWLAGEYVYLPNASGEQIAAAAEAASRLS